MLAKRYKRQLAVVCLGLLLSALAANANIFGQLHGIVHDPQHRPIGGAGITLRAVDSEFALTATTDLDGLFSLAAVPLGDYKISVSETGFQRLEQFVTLASGTSPLLHFELQLDSVRQSVSVTGSAEGANVDSATSTTLVSRSDIARTPGAERTNSMAMITDYVPGAYMTHDMLHVRGGHQVSWQIDGVQIPNTNIASNLGAQIDPKDIDYLEVQRGSYTADVGDRTYAVFNVVPRTGFERNREGELILSAGNYWQTNDQLNFGGHSEKAAYYASLTGNRSNYGLSPPIARTYHDAANGFGGFASFIINRTAANQFRLVTQLRRDYFQIPYDPDPNSLGNLQYNSSALRDDQHELDGVVTFSWLHTFNPSTLLQLSPFYHYNRASYQSDPRDVPVATTSDRSSNYVGVQSSIAGEVRRNTFEGGIYAFGQSDRHQYGSIFNDSSYPSFSIRDAISGGVIEEYVSDNYKIASWATITGGLRHTTFLSSIDENATCPRVGLALQLPRLKWVLRGFYGRFYQPPPLLTASGSLVDYARSQNTTFVPLRGEKDEEYQLGAQLPFKGWVLDADNFKTYVNNFLDHSNVGESSIYFPVTIAGALIRAWEITLKSPQVGRFGQVHLAYSNQVAQQRGAITAGLICYPVSSAQCDATPEYHPVDHDQRNTFDVGYHDTLPWHAYMSTNINYGSGFSNGNPNYQYPGKYLPQHMSVDLSLGKEWGERTTISITGLNLANSRTLLDNSLTFGGFHYNDPRQMYAEVRYRFKY